MAFREVRIGRASDDVARQVIEAVIDGRLSPGDRLPSLSELEGIFGISRGTIREALRVLEREGVVEVRRGARGGTFVCAPSSSVLVDSLQLMLRLHQVSLEELAEFRELLEGRTAFIAGAARSESVLEELRAAVAALKGAEKDDWEVFGRAELACHVLLARATGNRLMEAVLIALRSAISGEFAAVPRELKRRIVDDWEDLLAAVEGSRAEDARTIMEHHIRDFAESVSKAASSVTDVGEDRSAKRAAGAAALVNSRRDVAETDDESANLRG